MTIDKKRRSLAKALAASSSAVVVGKGLPDGWITPVVENVVLPAHAQTSFPYQIVCTVEDTNGPCDPVIGNEFRVFGSVSGGDLQGVVLVIEYRNGTEEGDTTSDSECTGQGTFTTTTVVQAGNTFDETVLATPPVQTPPLVWCDPIGTVRVRFQDQATYGSAECSDTHNCEEVEEAING